MDYINATRQLTRSGDVIHPQLRPLGLGTRLVAASGGAATVGASVSDLRRGQNALNSALEVLETDQAGYTKMVALSEHAVVPIDKADHSRRDWRK